MLPEFNVTLVEIICSKNVKSKDQLITEGFWNISQFHKFNYSTPHLDNWYVLNATLHVYHIVT
jgi:hypothetical protein